MKQFRRGLLTFPRVSSLRLWLRALALLAVTCGGFVVWAVILPFAWLCGRRGRWRDLTLFVWARISLPILGVRCTVHGPVPRGACLLVANHLSYLDVLVLAARRPLTFVAKAEVAHWPLIGWMAAAIGIVFVRREQKRDLPAVAARIGRELAAGSAIVLFPEGTSSPGDTVLPFRPSLLAHAANGNLPVAHATLAYRTPAGSPPARLAVAWWGDMTFAPHVAGLLRLPYVEATITFGDEPLCGRDRKELAERLWREVATRLPAATAEPVNVL